MKILMVNKFLYPNGGSETYVFKLGACLKEQGHPVEYFGMEHEKRIVGNRVESYTSNLDFHTGGISKLAYPFKIIYSSEARSKIRKVLDDFLPDVVHLNNFNFQLTPSLIYEIRKFARENQRNIQIVMTAHDYQLVCPNHMMRNPLTQSNCERCLGGHFFNCTTGKCIHGSTVKSAIGMVEGYFYKALKTYQYLDRIICPSQFLAEKLNSNPLFRDKTIVIHNFIDEVPWKHTAKENYVLYFGRYSAEKGILTLLEVCQSLPEIPFVFAGAGPLEGQVYEQPNIENVGFQTGDALESLIRKARFCVFPSEWYENCPFTVMEAQMYGTPVLAADIGGIPELIQTSYTGELFRSGDKKQLKEKIQTLWQDENKVAQYSKNCQDIHFDKTGDYVEKLLRIYAGLG